jgi:hypothetical protein
MAALLLLLPAALGAQQISFPTPDGSRLLAGRIDLRRAEILVVKVDAVPTSISGFGGGTASTWYLQLADGSLQKLVVEEGGKSELFTAGHVFPGDTMLSIDTAADGPRIFSREAYAGNFLGLPVSMPAARGYAAVGRSGQLIINGSEDSHRLSLDFLHDGRIVRDGSGRLLLLTGNSSRYRHGILGDRIEATGFAIVETDPVPRVVNRFTLKDKSVFETLRPIWKDMDGDGNPDIILTRSESRGGAGLQIYSQEGRLIAAGDPIGRGFRWLHLLAAGPLGPGGELEIAAVLTPHIGGRLEYYRLKKRRLIPAHSRSGYSTHRIGSRNLDTALAGDFNADGRMELLLPRQNFRILDSLRRTESGLEIDFSVDLRGELSTNIAGYSFAGEIFLALGTDAGEVILFRPR